MTDSPNDPPPWVTGPPPGYVPPRSLSELRDPEVQARIDATGSALVREVIATLPRRGAAAGDHCPTHPDQPAGRYGGGDLRCTPCRHDERENR